MDPTTTPDATAVMAAMILLAIALCLPLLIFTLLVRRPLKVSRDATSLGRGWRLTHVTGLVMASRRHTETTTVTYGPSYGNPYGSASTRTDVYDQLSLQLANGEHTNVEVVNFNVSAFPGQVVSFWTARKGSKAFTFTVLNHTTRQTNTNDQKVFEIMMSSTLQIVFVIYLLVIVIPIAVISVFGGYGIPFVILFGLVVWFFLAQRRVRRTFRKVGIGTIWERSHAEAQPMLWPQA